jgi:hypothetical protein
MERQRGNYDSRTLTTVNVVVSTSTDFDSARD